MNQRRVVLLAAVWLALGALARGDVVIKVEGQSMGDVVQTSATEVTLQARGSSAQTKIPVNEIRIIRYSDEPARLTSARTAIEAGRNEDAVTGLEGIDVADIRRQEIREDVAFFTALAKARIALAGADQEAVVEAGKLMAAFVKNSPGSYHYYQACEVLGDLYVAVGQYAAARSFYGQVAQAPWADYQMRAAVALGRALLAEGKTDDALGSFEKVLAIEGTGESATEQRLAATLGKARCLAESGQADEAVNLIQGVIEEADAEQTQLHARAYNALGAAHRKAGRVQDALLAYLHVDVLYFNSPEEHIEALENLVELWEEAQQPERADRETRILQERYNRAPRSQ
jgi:tetratricopeptide (TPR) repeat protein